MKKTKAKLLWIVRMKFMKLKSENIVKYINEIYETERWKYCQLPVI